MCDAAEKLGLDEQILKCQIIKTENSLKYDCSKQNTLTVEIEDLEDDQN